MPTSSLMTGTATTAQRHTDRDVFLPDAKKSSFLLDDVLVAIMTACVLPLNVNAIAISSGMSRWPATRWPASEAVRGRRATEGSRFGTVISASGIKRPRFGHAGIMSGRLLGHFEIVASSTFKWLGDHLRR
jgi:hypothetical protein